MIKFRLYLDKDQETDWLNKMAEEGWAMKKFFAGFYTFEKCEPGQYTYQVDFGERFCSVTDDYKEFMEDTGAEIVQSWGFWVILRKLSNTGPFELYTDVDSSIAHYMKIRNMFRIVAVFEIFVLLFELWAGIHGASVGYICACLIGAMLFAIINVIVKTNDTISELKERKGEITEGERNRKISALLPCGLLLNSCVLMIQESISSPIKLFLQILTVFLMLTGVYQTGKKRKM